MEEDSAVVFTVEAGKIVLDRRLLPTHAEALEAAGCGRRGGRRRTSCSRGGNAVAAFNLLDLTGLVEMTMDDFEVDVDRDGGAHGLPRSRRVRELLGTPRSGSSSYLEAREFRDLGDEVLVVGMFHARGGGSGVEIRRRTTPRGLHEAAESWRGFSSYQTEDEALEAGAV